MDLTEYVINDVKPQGLTTKINELQILLNHLTYSHIPVVNDEQQFLGMISENDVYCFDVNEELGAFSYAIEQFFVTPNTNWLDVLEAFAKNASNIMPIIDDKTGYVGYYELHDIMALFSEMPFFIENGAVLIVENGVKDFSFSQVTQIVESNNAKLFGAFLSKISNDMVQITLKLNNEGLAEIMQTFRRYGYNIISSHDGDTYVENLKERSAYLKKYLNI
jgi:predicted transcriptional regulator